MGALPRPDVAPGPHRELVDALHALHHRAGWPSLRVLAAQTGVSHTTVSKVLSSPSLPSWGNVELLTEALGGDVLHFHGLWLSASTPPADGARASAGQIAGRTAELAAVQSHLDTGSGMLLVTGEAGIGKTTLVAAAAAASRPVVAVGHCLRLSSEVPLLPVIDALRGLHQADEGQWLQEALATCPAYVRTSLGILLPELLSDEAVRAVDDPWGLERLFSSVTAVMRGLAAIRPLALHLEDCHWADRTTIDLLTHLTGNPAGIPLLVTWRSGDPDVLAGHSEWLSRSRWAPGVSVIDLGPLTLAETTQQLRLLTAASVDDDDAIAIQARSQGLPLYTAQLATAGPGDELPSHLADLLDRRIGDLDNAAWRVARVLGVAQRQVGTTVLRAADGLDADEEADALHALDDRGLLRRGRRVLGLAHPLYIEAIERRLLPGEAQEVHARLAEALTAETVEPGEIAGHWRAAGRPDLEAPQRVAAARRAGARSAYRDELDAWLRVLELWDAGHAADEMEQWDVVTRAIDAALEAGDLDAGRTLVRRAEGLDLLDHQRAQVLERIGVFLCEDGMHDRGVGCLDEALALLEGPAPSPALLHLLSNRSSHFLRSGQFAEAEAELSRALETLEVQDDPRLRRGFLAESAWLTMRTGDYDRALEMSRRAHAIDLPEPDPLADAALAINTTDIMLHAGASAAEVEQAADNALSQRWARNVDDTNVGVILRSNVCWARLQEGDVAAAREVIEPVSSAQPSLVSAIAHVMLAAVEMREGRAHAAIDRCRAADAQFRNRNMQWVEGVPWQAEVELWAGSVHAALDLLREALEVALPIQMSLKAAPLVSKYARAHADRADAVDATVAERRRVMEDLHEVVAGAVADPFGAQAFDAAVPGLARAWHAELARLAGRASVDLWVGAAREWDRLTRPHDAAYCRWRAAEVALRESQGTVAARLLKRASADAHQHVPLSEAITATGRGV
ncbi:MAG TPA: AAA family ATPase [Nocardioides sp.]|nr:AAA family ATPase [Nocardioides sp.]